MKPQSFFAPVILLLGSITACGQGTFIYDQQSSTDEITIAGNAVIQQMLSPYGQSFTPTLSAVDFIRLKLNDRNPGNGLGATLYVNLRTGSVSGPVLATTALVSFPDGFAGVSNFFFSNSVTLIGGTVYYFQPVVQPGPGNDLWNLDAGEYNYPGGSVFANGMPATASDYWFREGIVPEPSSALLSLLGFGPLLLILQRKRSTRCGRKPDE